MDLGVALALPKFKEFLKSSLKIKIIICPLHFAKSIFGLPCPPNTRHPKLNTWLFIYWMLIFVSLYKFFLRGVKFNFYSIPQNYFSWCYKNSGNNLDFHPKWSSNNWYLQLIIKCLKNWDLCFFDPKHVFQPILDIKKKNILETVINPA